MDFENLYERILCPVKSARKNTGMAYAYATICASVLSLKILETQIQLFEKPYIIIGEDIRDTAKVVQGCPKTLS